MFDRHACLSMLYAGEVDHIRVDYIRIVKLGHDWTWGILSAKEVTAHVDKGVVNYIKSCELYNSYYLFVFYVCCGICLFMCVALFVRKYVSLLLTLIGTSLKLGDKTLQWIK